MKRITSLILAVMMALSLGCVSALGINLMESADESSVKDVAEEYLRGQMEQVYLWREKRNVPQNTILDVVENGDIATVTNQSGSADTLIPAAGQNTLATMAETNAQDFLDDLERSDVTMKDMIADLRGMAEYTKFRQHVFEDMGITFSNFDAEYIFDSVEINGDYAVVNAYEKLEYQYSDCDEPSSELNCFSLALANVNGKWAVADVVTDDAPFQAFLADGHDAETVIADYDKAVSMSAVSQEVSQNPGVMTTSYPNNIAYAKSNARNYALMYTTLADTGSTPTFKNDRFKWWGADCMNFASQVMWAGFGGSNSWGDVTAHYGMDTSGSYKWWSDHDTAISAWISCAGFRDYVTGSNSSSEKGLHFTVTTTAYNSGSINWSGTAGDLVGAVMHVKGSSGTYGHAVVVNDATSLSRNDIYICCYNNCKKNVKLGQAWPASSTNSQNAIKTFVPTAFIQGESGPRVWGNWVTNVNVTTSSRTLIAQGTELFSEIKIELLDPAGIPRASNSDYVSNYVSLTYNNWDSTGDHEWTVKVTGKISDTEFVTWYGAVRVAKS